MLSTERLVRKDSDYYIYTPGSLASNLFLYPSIVGHFTYQSGYRLSRDSFDSFLCIYVKNGCGTILSGKERYEVSRGQIILLDCYQPHTYEVNQPWETLWMHFDGVQARGYYDAITQGKNLVVTLSSTYRFEKYLTKIYEAFRDSTPVNDATLNNWIVNMMTELLVSRESTDRSANGSDVIEDVVSYIMEHLSEDVSLEELARKASLSPFYFSRLFKKETGFTPHDYILTTRINHAKFLLLTSSLSIKDICFQLGFSSESAFCTAFKKKIGETPSEFRTNHTTSF
jgi:AraC-like DNA-binding protein